MATSTNFNKILYSVALIFIFKKYLALELKKVGHRGYIAYCGSINDLTSGLVTSFASQNTTKGKITLIILNDKPLDSVAQDKYSDKKNLIVRQLHQKLCIESK